MLKTDGFSLIEVLVALTIFTVSLLGMVEAQLIALKQNQHILNQAIVRIQENNIREEIYGINSIGYERNSTHP